MENFSREIIDLVCDDWKDDEDLVMSALYYLYHTTNDDKMKNQIVDIFNDYEYCIDCGSKLKTRTIKEYHNELDNNQIEEFVEYYCENCDK